MNSPRDNLFAQTLGDPGLFTFNEAVVGVFPDMIQRSVPGYSTVIAMTGLLAARHARPDSRIYDLGCSLGASLLSAARHSETDACEMIGIDNSEAMLSQCRVTLDREQPDNRITLIAGDITKQEYSNASVFIMNYTLQFIAPQKRLALLTKLRGALQPGDILILSEKIELGEQAMNELMIDMHHDFKRAQGYSDLEIAKKRQAIENVLIPETRDAHFARLKQAGFRHCECWFQCFNFASLIAVA